MHLCFITSEYPEAEKPHGGIGTFVQTLGRALVQKGCRVSVVGIGGTVGESNDQGVRIIRIAESNWPKFRFVDNSVKLNRCIRKIHQLNKIDLLETAEAGLAFLQKIPNVKYVVRLHGGHHFFSESENRSINLWKGWQEKRSIALADAFVAVSKYVFQHSSHYLDFVGRPYETIPYPIDTKKFSPSIYDSAVRGKIVFAGTVCEKKGVRQLLVAMSIVCKEFPEAHLEIYGRDWHYPTGHSYIQEMLEILQKMPVARVHFMGAISHDDLPEKYARAEVCIFPSHMETQGLVAPESMAMAKPVVFTKLGPGPETISHGKNGLLCDPHSPVDIAFQINRFLKNPAEALKMGERAREAVLQKYEVQKVTRQNLDFFQKIISTN